MSARELKRYFGWDGYEEMRSDFARTDWSEDRPVPRHHPGFPTEAEVLCAFNSEPDYSMSAAIYFERNGELFELEAGHCSCYGYEECNDWDTLKPITQAYLQKRPRPYPLNENDLEAMVCWDALVDGTLRAGK